MPQEQVKLDHGVTVTTMRLRNDVLIAASRKAETLGLTRTKYFEGLLRKDLRMEAKKFDIFS